MRVEGPPPALKKNNSRFPIFAALLPHMSPPTAVSVPQPNPRLFWELRTPGPCHFGPVSRLASSCDRGVAFLRVLRRRFGIKTIRIMTLGVENYWGREILCLKSFDNFPCSRYCVQSGPLATSSFREYFLRNYLCPELLQGPPWLVAATVQQSLDSMVPCLLYPMASARVGFPWESLFLSSSSEILPHGEVKAAES